MRNLIAQGLSVSGPGGQSIEVTGPLNPEIKDLGSLINILMPWAFAFIGVILLGIVIWGGYDYLLSQGDSSKMNAGKNKITYGLIGLILIAIALPLAKLVAKIFGLPF